MQIVSNKTTSILRPKFVGLDSSHLIAIIRDKNSADRKSRQSAKAFEDSFNASGSVLLLCWHHLEELLKHRDDAVVAQRVAFIRSLPMLAWVASFDTAKIVGTIADIMAFEAAAAFEAPEASAIAIRDQVAKGLFRIDSGQNAIGPFMREWRDLQPMMVEREDRNREIVAISRSGFTGIAKTKVHDWLKGQMRSSEDIKRQLGILRDRLADDIRLRGDKRITDAAQKATRFMDNVVRKASAVISDAANPGLQILSALGIDPKEIPSKMTMEEFGELLTFQNKLRVISRNLDAPWTDLKVRVTEDRLPSCIIQSALRHHGQDTPERKGSDLTDSYLACLSAYADITYLDKRTLENFRRARQKSSAFAALVRRVEKAGSYQEITSHLP